MPGQRIAKVASALVVASLLAAGLPEASEVEITASDSFVEVLTLPDAQTMGTTENAGCNDC